MSEINSPPSSPELDPTHPRWPLFDEDAPFDPLQYYSQRSVVFYPWGGAARRIGIFTFPPNDVSLTNVSILDDNFWCSPASCQICPKPHLKHQAIPDASFTIVIFCPHHVRAAEQPAGPNQAVAQLLLGTEEETCVGDVMVIKHNTSGHSGPNVSNQSLPVVDVSPDDLIHVDEIVCRWVKYIYLRRSTTDMLQLGERLVPTYQLSRTATQATPILSYETVCQWHKLPGQVVPHSAP
ncbi:hypothetical protein K438DRAFT_1977184 [Mycena galopus ATCC 62051]|nr:hypothetical protein K438DRAFT_2004154 [Mycena galopus ATCC 62051]KAF8179825.1 hypothetical protein K438DRAFT_1977184 [Mycena galopus ATCC 62051]